MDKLLKKLEQEYIGKYDNQLRYILQEYSIPEIVAHMMQWMAIEWSETNNLNHADITTIVRDFYIGSDLTEQEKEAYYSVLKQQGFFILLNKNLYSDDFAKCSWTIYTFGKFSDPENSIYLEKAYEALFSDTNPILSQRCLSELQWLASNKLDTYLETLSKSNNIISKLTLLLYWGNHCDNAAINKLLSDKELIKFISPQSEKISKAELLSKLNGFENHIFCLCNEHKNIKLNKNKFIELATHYFENVGTAY